ncbi:unnamed protein product [Caenorhabditis auriculariae]|nr:unnamed protein product [Caenorhabditis auriculariae]
MKPSGTVDSSLYWNKTILPTGATRIPTDQPILTKVAPTQNQPKSNETSALWRSAPAPEPPPPKTARRAKRGGEATKIDSLWSAAAVVVVAEAAVGRCRRAVVGWSPLALLLLPFFPFSALAADNRFFPSFFIVVVVVRPPLLNILHSAPPTAEDLEFSNSSYRLKLFTSPPMGIKGSKPKLSKEDLEFLKKNTNFTEEQIKEWYKGFVQDCPKGHLTKEQFIKVYKDFFPSGSAEGFCEHVFRTFDTDNSGFIDFKEFLLAINVTSSGTPEQKLEWAFRMYDIDGNGTIDEKEMIKIIEAIYEMLGPEVTKSADDSPRKRAKMIFEKMDVNNDKELTLKEFVDGCLADKELFQILTNEVKK